MTVDQVVDGGEPGARATYDLAFDSDVNIVCCDITTTGPRRMR